MTEEEDWSDNLSENYNDYTNGKEVTKLADKWGFVKKNSMFMYSPQNQEIITHAYETYVRYKKLPIPLVVRHTMNGMGKEEIHHIDFKTGMMTDEDSGTTYEIMGPLVRSSAHTAGSKKKRIKKRMQKKSKTKKNKKHVRK
jgi:hypothetical protein